MNAASNRRVSLTIHGVGSLIVGTYLYSPWSSSPTFAAITLYVVFPTMAVSGIFLWQQARIRRWLKAHGTAGKI